MDDDIWTRLSDWLLHTNVGVLTAVVAQMAVAAALIAALS